MKLKGFARLLWTLLAILLLLVSSVGTTSAERPAPDFEVLSGEMARMNNLFRIGPDNQSIVFESDAARRQGFSSKSITLAEETAAFTNDLVAAAVSNARMAGIATVETISIEGVNVDISKYPALAAYHAWGAQHVKDNPRSSLPAVSSSSPEDVCGCVGNPVPSYAVHWRTQGPYGSQSEAEQQLTNWGYYHAYWVPPFTWTRDQTYNEALCKRNTYRDEGSNPFQDPPGSPPWYFNEQNYTGTVPGEPNPVMSVWPGDWPYATWPAYVLWWHDNVDYD